MRVALIALVLAGVACGSRAAPPPVEHHDDAFSGVWSPRPSDPAGAEVIATVNGEPIYAADVGRHAGQRGIDVHAALAELIDGELLAQEARRRGMLDDPDVRATLRRERARRLIETEFAATFDGPEDVPEADVAQTYNHPSVHPFYNHEMYHVVSYARVPAEDKRVTPGQIEAARQVADEIYAATTAAKPRSSDEFLAVARRVASAHGVELQHAQGYATTRHLSSVEEFAKPAFSITKPGEIARPALTPWGWDVIFLESIIPARATPLAEAAPEIRLKRFEPAREAAFGAWADALVHRAQVRRDDALLQSIEVIAPVQLK